MREGPAEPPGLSSIVGLVFVLIAAVAEFVSGVYYRFERFVQQAQGGESVDTSASPAAGHAPRDAPPASPAPAPPLPTSSRQSDAREGLGGEAVPREGRRAALDARGTAERPAGAAAPTRGTGRQPGFLRRFFARLGGSTEPGNRQPLFKRSGRARKAD